MNWILANGSQVKLFLNTDVFESGKEGAIHSSVADNEAKVVENATAEVDEVLAERIENLSVENDACARDAKTPRVAKLRDTCAVRAGAAAPPPALAPRIAAM